MGAHMGLLDKLRRKKQIGQDADYRPPRVVEAKDKVFAILEAEIKDFFPDTGHWYSTCFRRPREVAYCNLPCHLRDNTWMSQLLHKKLIDKGIYIRRNTIQGFLNMSENFKKLRHEYELKIVQWQIKWIISGGENWLLPDGYDEFSLLCSDKVENLYRGGVKKTLKAIGMDEEVIEEGLEKYSDIWRDGAMRTSFNHLYQPVMYLVGSPKAADEEHRKNWIADREYQYYQAHKQVVDKYGTKTPAMFMSPERHAKLLAVLEKQNEQRRKEIDEWRKTAKVKSEFSYFTNID